MNRLINLISAIAIISALNRSLAKASEEPKPVVETDDAHLDFAEKQGAETYKYHAEANAALHREIHTTLSILSAGMGAGMAFLIKEAAERKHQTEYHQALVGLTIYLGVLALFTVHKCLWAEPGGPPSNEPLKVFRPEFNLASIRRLQLSHLNKSIVAAAKRGQRRGLWMNRVRTAMLLSPLLYLGLLCLFRHLQQLP